MKNIIILILMLFMTTFICSQKSRGEEVYLLFDETSNKKCKIIINDSIVVRKYYTRTIKFCFCDDVEFQTLKRKKKRPSRRNASIESVKEYKSRRGHAYSNAAALAASNSYNPQIPIESISEYNIVTIDAYKKLYFNSKVTIIRKVSNEKALLYHRIVSINRPSDTISENIPKQNLDPIRNK